MFTPEMKAHRRMQEAIRKNPLDRTETCFSGKTKMTMAQLRSIDKMIKKNKVRPSRGE